MSDAAPERPDDELYSIAEVARRIGFSEEYVRIQIRKGRLEAVKFSSNKYRVRPSQLEAFIAGFELS